MRKPKPSAPKYTVPALEKGLDILEALAASSTPQSLAGLARTLDRTSSEIFRMLTVLERRQYIERDAVSGSYSLSLKLYELAHTHAPVEHLVRTASRPMRELAEELRESCHLSVLSRGKLVVLHQVESPEEIKLAIDVGARFSAVRTNSGRLLLAHLPVEDLAGFLRGDPGYAALSGQERRQLKDQLERIRELGHSVAESRTRPGMKDIAVLVGNPAVGVFASLAIPCLFSGRDEASVVRLLTALLNCAAEITSALGLKR